MIKSLIESVQKLLRPPIHKIIQNNWNNGAKNLHINLFLNKQILFQVLTARHFEKKRLILTDQNDMAIIHFFNKNKTITFDKLEKFKRKINRMNFIMFESKKNINFIKNLGNNPKIIEQEILKNIDLYDLSENQVKSITTQFIDFKEKNKQ